VEVSSIPYRSRSANDLEIRWCFQFQDDAQNFQRQLRERFAQFNLELASAGKDQR
jgi:hypothetical protein